MNNPITRILDIVISLAGIVILLPLSLVLTLIGLFYTSSPFFLQQRLGKDQQPFTLIKFRTMEVGTASLGTHEIGQQSITPFGRFLRRTKLDEIPQLLNVLFGHMSMVGPRPCLPVQTELIKEREKRGVFRCRPGITGLAQINAIDMSTPKKLARIDSLMIRNFSLTLYVALIIATATGRGFGDRVRAK